MNRTYTANGERREEVCYIPIVVWGKQAEICTEYLTKGRQALVEGRLSQQSWETPEGQRRTRHEVVAEQIRFLGTPKREESESEPEEVEVPF